MVHRASKPNLIYAALAGVALLLIAPYFGLGSLLGGRNSEEPAPPKRRVVGSDVGGPKRRLAEEPRKNQKSSASADSPLDDIEAMLGNRSRTEPQADEDEPNEE